MTIPEATTIRLEDDRAEPGFHICCAVIHTGTAQFIEAIYVEQSIRYACGNDH